ncbi:MAG: hypothetical protein GXY52_08310 [Chloroflexi bacterium]|nr:hypothetical protein [Chloroflexota bacterium]
MPYNMVAFASLPFGLRSGSYELALGDGTMQAVLVTPLRFNPFVTLAACDVPVRGLPQNGQGDGFISYTWYDHPFVLRVAFGPNIASLGSINSSATIVQPLEAGFDPHDKAALHALSEDFAAISLEAFNTLIAIVRRQARLYQVHDLIRSDIQITIRDEQGAFVADDPREVEFTEEDRVPVSLDLSERDSRWYEELAVALRGHEGPDLADELLMEAERALDERFPRQALATCNTVMETAVSQLLTVGMSKRGLSTTAIDDLLLSRSLAAKLDSLLETNTGYSLKRHNRALWNSFDQLSSLRNDAIHRGANVSVQDAQFALQVTRDVLAWLAFVRSRLSKS